MESLPPEQLLRDAELVVGTSPTYAALVLLATQHALKSRLPQSEIVFEYRNAESSVEYQQRAEFRQGFLPILDELWNLINLRNEAISFQLGLFRWEIPVFNEAVVREAILNALTHRDYRLPGSVFIRQYPIHGVLNNCA